MTVITGSDATRVAPTERWRDPCAILNLGLPTADYFFFAGDTWMSFRFMSTVRSPIPLTNDRSSAL